MGKTYFGTKGCPTIATEDQHEKEIIIIHHHPPTLIFNTEPLHVDIFRAMNEQFLTGAVA